MKLANLEFKRIGTIPNRPTIVFLHDSLGCIELWRDFPEKLGDWANCNVLIYDRQGYGKSCGFSDTKRDETYMEQEADILNQLLEYLGIDKALLFGHSDGGSIALIAAAKYPQKIIGIITEGAHVFVEDISIRGIKESMVLYQNTNLKERLMKYHGQKTDSMFRAWVDTWTSPEFKNWNIEHFLPAIQCPALIIQGEDDEYGTLRQVEAIIAQTNMKARNLIIPHVKHSPHKEAPELLLEKTTEFIKTIQ